MRGSIQRFSKISASFGLGFMLIWSAACGDQELAGVESEVNETSVQLDLPEVPTFDMPSAHPDGTHSVDEMRLKGRTLFESEVVVKGYVTWIYSCEEEMRTPEMTEEDVKKLIEEQPDKCNRPHFFIGDSADTLPEKSLWVVENPRPPRKDERKNYTRAQIKAINDAIVPFELGDEVVIKGTWDQKSPAGFFNSDGLLTYGAMKNITQDVGSLETAPTE